MKKYGIILGVLFSIPVFAQEVQEAETLVLPSVETFVLPTESEKQVSYTWVDFLEGKTCQEDFNRLNAMSFLSQKRQF